MGSAGPGTAASILKKILYNGCQSKPVPAFYCTGCPGNASSIMRALKGCGECWGSRTAIVVVWASWCLLQFTYDSSSSPICGQAACCSKNPYNQKRTSKFCHIACDRHWHKTNYAMAARV